MSDRKDLTRWNRAGLSRFRYVDGNAVTYLEALRETLAEQFPQWNALQVTPPPEADEPHANSEYLRRIQAQYHGERQDYGWEIARSFARACHVLTEHLDAYANEAYLGTATQWDNVRRIVEMLDYHPAPPASASTALALVLKEGAAGTVAAGLQFKYTPPEGGAPVIFETLEDLEADAQLNDLRPRDYDRNPSSLSGSRLQLEGAIDQLKTGDPVVLEDTRSGALRAYRIQGVVTSDDATQIDLSPRLWNGFVAGHTLIHVVPKDRLDPQGPVHAGQEVEIDRQLRLTDVPASLLPGQVVWISDGKNRYFRRVQSIRERALIFDTSLGRLAVAQATVSPVVHGSVTRVVDRTTADGGDVVVLLMAGDWSRLGGSAVADVCRGPDDRQSVVSYSVMAANYHRPEVEHEWAGYTELRVSLADAPADCQLVNPQALLVPPAGSGAWATDTYLEKVDGHLPPTLTVAIPKKTAAGDVAVVMRGGQMAWGRLSHVAIDEQTEQAQFTAADGWQDRGGADYFLADTRIYSHFAEVCRPVGWQQNEAPLSGRRIPLDSVPAGLKRGRAVVVSHQTDSAVALSTRVSAVDAVHKEIELADALPSGLTYSSAHLTANVVTAGHGQSYGEKVLGSGRATESNQSFLLEVAGVSFVADATQASGVRADIAVRVDGREWSQVSNLNDSRAADHHYIVRMTEAGFIRIQFGDGRNGRRLPTGTNNVRVAYRKGSGLRGNIPPDVLTKPAKPHRLVKAVRQPLAATGGNDMEGVASLRSQAPRSVLTLERAVSVSDFGQLAASQSSVWQARAFERPPMGRRRAVIEVVVVPAGGGELGSLATTLTDYLLAHALPGVDIRVLPYETATFDLDVRLTVDTQAYDPDTVRETVSAALAARFALPSRRLGQDLFLSEVYQVVEAVAGVSHSQVRIDGNPSLRRRVAHEREVLVLGERVVTVNQPAVTDMARSSRSVQPSLTTGVRRSVDRRSVFGIQGVGGVFGRALRRQGIRTMADLQALDPNARDFGIPHGRLWEIKTKAALVGEFAIDATWSAAVLNLTLAQAADMEAPALARLAGRSTEDVNALQAGARRMQMVLDDELFQGIRLQEFVRDTERNGP